MAALIEQLAVAADDARQPLAGELTCWRTAVGGRCRIVRGCEPPEPHVRVATRCVSVRNGEGTRAFTEAPAVVAALHDEITSSQMSWPTSASQKLPSSSK